MASAAELALILSLVDDVTDAAKSIKGELGDIGKTAQESQGLVGKVTSGLAGIGKAAIVGGIGLATAGVTALSGALTWCVSDAMASQEAAAQLNAVLESTGGAAGMTFDELNDMAGALQDVTRFEDETIMAGQSMLLTFKNIGGDVFPRATEALLDMSQAMGQDPKTAAIQLGKALNDPILGITALTRVGIQFTDAQKDAIKAMVEAGDVAGAQGIILAELESQFGGSAVAAGQTFAGQLDRLRNKFGDVRETIGMALMPALEGILEGFNWFWERIGPEVVAVFERMVPVIGVIAQGLADIGIGFAWLLEGAGVGAMLEYVSNALYDMGAALGIPEEQVRAFVTGFEDLAFTIEAFVTEQLIPFVKEHAEELKTALIAIGAIIAAATIASGIMSIVAAVGALANPITLIIVAVGLLAAAWAGNWGGIQDKTKAVIEWLKPYVIGAIEAVRQFWADNGEQIMATVAGMWAWIKQAFSDALAWVKWAVSDALTWVRAFWAAHGEQIMAVIGAMWDWIKARFETSLAIVQGIIDAVTAAIHGDWYAFGEAMRTVVDNLWSQIVAVFTLSKDALFAIITAAVTGIVNIWNGIDWSAVGAGIINGIKNGITAGLSALKEAARKAAQAALDAAKGFLGINSPSTVTAALIGRPFVEGIGLGIDQAIDRLARVQMPDITARLVGAAMPSAGSQTPTRNGDTYNLHIHTSAPVEPILADFDAMRAWGGV